MSDDFAVKFDRVGKMYKAFGSKLDNLFDALSLPSLGGRQRYREFWALRDVDLELPRGGRLGIIGRNGAGKSTLLKLVTGNHAPTEGRITVNGNVQALLEIGGGLHPEFTGSENIRASLGYLGLSRSEIEDAEREIAEFTELGRFLQQPFRTYSQGMQARLSFAIATSVQPEILIVDEILGAGDAYFFGRSMSRMTEMIDSGASVLLVSHSFDQIVRFCDEAIWIDRGRIVTRGPSTEVVKAYEQFVRELEDQRLQAKNKKAALPHYDSFDRETFTDSIAGAVSADGASVDVARIALWRDGALEQEIGVGDPQDASPGASAALILEGGHWEPPERDGESCFRAVSTRGEGPFRFSLWFFYPGSRYEVEIVYRAADSDASLRLDRTTGSSTVVPLPRAAEWSTHRIQLALDGEQPNSMQEERLSRWPGVDGLVMTRVRMVNEHEDEQALFRVHEPFSVVVDAVATSDGAFPLVPAALAFRLDGVVATRHVGEREVLDLREGDRIQLRLDLGPLQLGDGAYLLSVGLYQELDVGNSLSSTLYDYFDRSFEFAVTGNPPLHTEAFRHPGRWSTTVTKGSSELARTATDRG